MPSWSAVCSRLAMRASDARRLRLAGDPMRAEAARGNAGAVAGIGQSPQTATVTPGSANFMRLAQASVADEATNACGRREAVCRLGGRHYRGRQSGHREGAAGAHLRRRPRGIELHLGGGALERDAAGLDRCARPCSCGDRRSTAGAGARQSQNRHYQAVARGDEPASIDQDLADRWTPSRFRRASAARPTRRKSRWPCRSSSASSRRSCATARSSRWSKSNAPSSLRRPTLKPARVAPD